MKWNKVIPNPNFPLGGYTASVEDKHGVLNLIVTVTNKDPERCRLDFNYRENAPDGLGHAFASSKDYPMPAQRVFELAPPFILNKVQEISICSNDKLGWQHVHEHLSAAFAKAAKPAPNPMNPASQMSVKETKAAYPEGTRIRLIHMEDGQAVPDGTFGTVRFVDDAGQIHMAWDGGGSLALIPGVDDFEVV